MTPTEKQLLPRVARMEMFLGVIPKEGQSITERVKVLSDRNEIYQNSQPKPTWKDDLKLIIVVILFLAVISFGLYI